MDLSCKLGEKVIHRDESGLYQSFECSYELTEKDIPKDSLKEKAAELQLKVKKLLISTKLKEKLITQEQAIEELRRYTSDDTTGKQ